MASSCHLHVDHPELEIADTWEICTVMNAPRRTITARCPAIQGSNYLIGLHRTRRQHVLPASGTPLGTVGGLK